MLRDRSTVVTVFRSKIAPANALAPCAVIRFRERSSDVTVSLSLNASANALAPLLPRFPLAQVHDRDRDGGSLLLIAAAASATLSKPGMVDLVT